MVNDTHECPALVREAVARYPAAAGNPEALRQVDQALVAALLPLAAERLSQVEGPLTEEQAAQLAVDLLRGCLA